MPVLFPQIRDAGQRSGGDVACRVFRGPCATLPFRRTRSLREPRRLAKRGEYNFFTDPPWARRISFSYRIVGSVFCSFFYDFAAPPPPEPRDWWRKYSWHWNKKLQRNNVNRVRMCEWRHIVLGFLFFLFCAIGVRCKFNRIRPCPLFAGIYRHICVACHIYIYFFFKRTMTTCARAFPGNFTIIILL